MILKQGNMWSEVGKCDLILFTANATVKQDKKLVMGGGAAKEALEHYPDSDEVFGNILLENDLVNEVYGLVFKKVKETTSQFSPFATQETILGAFQTKKEVWKNSTLELVEYSTELLRAVAHNWDSIVLNMPGTGLGGLNIQDVMPIVETLPDNVTVYTYKNEPIKPLVDSADRVFNKLLGSNE